MSLKEALAEAVTPKRKPSAIEKIYAKLDDDDKAAFREAVENLTIGPTFIAQALKAEGHHATYEMVKKLRDRVQRGEYSWEL